MSSREIADLTGSSHDNMMKTIRGLIEKGVVFGNETPFTHPQNKQTYAEFLLDYRNTMVVASGYSAELRARIVDRWLELEAGSAGTPTRKTIPFTTARREFEALRRFAKDLGLDDNQAVLRASKGIERAYGVDLMSAIGTPLLEAPHQELLCTVTEIGMRLGGVGARETNRLLIEHGFQRSSRDHHGDLHYEATDLGRPHSRIVDQDKARGDGAPVQQLRWLTSVVDPLKAAQALASAAL